jgi:tRNA threonylcarbamoyladenosine biosynthesis protein TsaB
MSNLNILMLETATEQCVVALKTGQKILSRSHHEMRQHARVIFDLIENVLSEGGVDKSAIDVIAFGCGPGSFTGLRVAASVAQSLAFGLSKPVVPVSTLQCLAQSALHETDYDSVLVALDARMGELYWAHYVRDPQGLALLEGTETLSKAADVRLPKGKPWMVVGSALREYPEFLSACEECPKCVMRLPNQLLDPVAILNLAEARFMAGAAVSPEMALPVYLRDQVVK